jgi:hypothetical protein
MRKSGGGGVLCVCVYVCCVYVLCCVCVCVCCVCLCVLGWYQVDIVALQETKWFGDGVYNVGDSIVLASGRAAPGVGVVRQRGGGLLLFSPVQQLVRGRLVVVTGRHGALGWLRSS